MADALDLGSSSVRSAGSSPVSCTIFDSFPSAAGISVSGLKKLRHSVCFFRGCRRIEVNYEIWESG